ncbi:MAG: hypothetical protein ACFFFC_17430 [Candidatus Thorarchaeota archaeon]
MNLEEYSRRLTARYLEIGELFSEHLIEAGAVEDNSKEETDSLLSSIFMTEQGLAFAEYAEKIQTFAMKGVFLLLPFKRFTSVLIELMNDDEYKELLTQSEDGDLNTKIIDVISRSLSHDVLNEADMDSIFDEGDERIFLAALTSTLHTCAERYCLDILNQVLAHEDVAAKILEQMKKIQFSLEDVKAVIEDSKKALDEKVRDVIKNQMSNPQTRLELIASGIGIMDSIENAMKATHLMSYKNLFRDFLKLRNKITHRLPAPEIEVYENWFIKDGMDALWSQFEKGMEKIDLPLESLRKVFTFVFEWIRERQKPFTIVLQLPIMATVYPALIDNAIDIWESMRVN